MRCRQIDTLAEPVGSVESGWGRSRGVGRLDWLATGQDVVDEPFPMLLTNNRFADHSGFLEHIVRGLEHPL